MFVVTNMELNFSVTLCCHQFKCTCITKIDPLTDKTSHYTQYTVTSKAACSQKI